MTPPRYSGKRDLQHPVGDVDGGGKRWVELTGPADPLLIRGAVVVPGSGSDLLGSGGSADAVLILLEASARLPGADAITGVEVNVRTSGPSVAERWEWTTRGSSVLLEAIGLHTFSHLHT